MNLSIQKKIREAYKEYTPEIISGNRKSPYDLGIDWMGLFSPIEDNVWGSIRYLGLPFYPQYPVGPYFLDFADLIRKIGIEVDSMKWHRNKEKDSLRQEEIEKMGWRIIRINSFLTYKISDDFRDEDGKIDYEKYETESAEGILLKMYRENGYFEQRYCNL